MLGGGVLDLQRDRHAAAIDALPGLSLIDVQHEIAVAEREACDARLVGRELAADLVAIERGQRLGVGAVEIDDEIAVEVHAAILSLDAEYVDPPYLVLHDRVLSAVIDRPRKTGGRYFRVVT